MQGNASGARPVQARKRFIVDRDAGEQVGDPRRVRRINFAQLQPPGVALDLETLKVSAPLRGVLRRLRLLQSRQQRAQTVRERAQPLLSLRALPSGQG